MKVYVYARVSTNSQTLDQQLKTVNDWLKWNNLKYDELISDEGISGKTSYNTRNLQGLINKLQPNDMIVVSEVSRLSRSISDFNILINKEFKPRKVRLVSVSLNIDVNCSAMTAIDEHILNTIAFCGQLDLEFNSGRTNAGLQARVARGEEIGGTTTLWGKNLNMTPEEKKIYRMNNLEKANRKSAQSKREAAKNNPNNKQFWDKYRIYISLNKSEKINYAGFAEFLNREGVKTQSGKEFDYFSTANTLNRLKRIYN